MYLVDFGVRVSHFLGTNTTSQYTVLFDGSSEYYLKIKILVRDIIVSSNFKVESLSPWRYGRDISEILIREEISFDVKF